MLLGIPVVLALAFPQNAQATPSVSIRAIQYIGTGCSRDEGDSISGSGFTRTLNLRNFHAGAGYALRRSSCNVVVAVAVPTGYQVALTANFKGSVRGSGKLVRSYGTSINPNGASLSSNLASVRGKRFSQNDAGNSVWSACRASSLNLRLNSSITAVSSASKISVDKMTLRVAVRPCR
jgi:hypothetical protein